MAVREKQYGYGLSGLSGQLLFEAVETLRAVARQEPEYAEELVIMSVELEALIRPAKPVVAFDENDMVLEFVDDELMTKTA